MAEPAVTTQEQEEGARRKRVRASFLRCVLFASFVYFAFIIAYTIYK